FLDPADPKRILNMVILGVAHHRMGRLAEALAYLEQALAAYSDLHDRYGAANVYKEMVIIFSIQGDWRRMFEARRRGLAILPDAAKMSELHGDLLGYWSPAQARAGRYAEAEQNSRASLSFRQQAGVLDITGPLHDLGFALGMQHKYAEADQYFQ